MKIKIGIPNNSIYNKLYIHSEKVAEKYNLEIIVLPEKDILSSFRNRRLDIALLSPLGYASGVKKADYRIISGPCLGAVSFSGFASILMKSGIKNINSLNSNTSEDFLMQIGKILLAERYNIILKLVQKNLSIEELFNQSDVSIIWGNYNESPINFDITEDWYDTYEFPLPLGMWCTYGDDPDENCSNIINELADESLKEYEEINGFDGFGEAKKGELIWKWNDDMQKSMEELVQMLFFHQLITDVPKIKLLEKE